MNFDLAAELAAAEGIEVATIAAADDVASAADRARDRAGAASPASSSSTRSPARAPSGGASLDEVRAVTERAAGRCGAWASRSRPAPSRRRPARRSSCPTARWRSAWASTASRACGAGRSRPADAVADELIAAILGGPARRAGDRGRRARQRPRRDAARGALHPRPARAVAASSRRRASPCVGRGSASTQRRSRWPARPCHCSGSTTSSRAAGRARALAVPRDGVSRLTAVIADVCGRCSCAGGRAERPRRAAAGDGDLGVTMAIAAGAVVEVLPDLARGSRCGECLPRMRDGDRPPRAVDVGHARGDRSAPCKRRAGDRPRRRSGAVPRSRTGGDRRAWKARRSARRRCSMPSPLPRTRARARPTRRGRCSCGRGRRRGRPRDHRDDAEARPGRVARRAVDGP